MSSGAISCPVLRDHGELLPVCEWDWKCGPRPLGVYVKVWDTGTSWKGLEEKAQRA